MQFEIDKAQQLEKLNVSIVNEKKIMMENSENVEILANKMEGCKRNKVSVWKIKK